MPLPKNFIQGIDTQRHNFETGLPSYLRGKWSKHGWWYYYLYAILIKTPLGTIGLFLLAIFCTLFLKGYNTDWRDELVVLLPGIAILAFVSSQTGFSIHSRYAIPALPFFFLWSCKVARAFTPTLKETAPRSSRAVCLIAMFLLVWSVASSLWVYPHSIAYFNGLAAVIPTPEDRNVPRPEPASPPTVWQKVRCVFDAGPLNGPRHLLDSNIDWGQDLYYLERWCGKHPDAEEMAVSEIYGRPANTTSIPATVSGPTDRERSQWYALSVNDLYGKDGDYLCFLSFTPVKIIGYTTYVYHVSHGDINRVKERSPPKKTNSGS